VKKIRKRLTYANVMSSIAVFLVIGGASAFAASHLGKNSVGKKQLKNNAVTSAKIKKNAVTAAKIKNGAITDSKIAAGAVGGSKLAAGAVDGSKIAAGAVGGTQLANGAVSGSKLAAGAVGAGNIASGAVGNAQTQLVKVFKAGAVPAIGNEKTSPKIELGSVGPFHFYGKCFTESGDVEARTYIELTSGVAVLGSEDAAEFESNTDGYLVPTTPEEDRALEEDASAGPDEFSANSDDEEFQASASDGTEITGLAAGTGAKQGTPPEGNGPFLAVDSCIIGAIAVFGS
jgi:hypothetical protein